ncbi:MAG: dihydropteroate synthase [Myxococcales bacterium]|nr:dihydropteroate synthase [Polyangiaceae bacterium]MDW8249141.1 dihydropteroate synthase [Myxococcales bacterium]
MNDPRGVLLRLLAERRPLLMGILNVTPDSFSDGGVYLGGAWERRIDQLLEEGADLIDIGGESTRPGAEPVAAEEQLTRVLEPVRVACSRGALVSIDTTSPLVARESCEAGALVVNDVSCLADPGLARVARDFNGWLLVMHSRGLMRTMRGFSTYPEEGYQDVVQEVYDELAQARSKAMAEGLAEDRIWVDPGLGFHKSAAQSYALLHRLDTLTKLGPVVVGASRKSFLARDVGGAPTERLGGTIAACLAAVRQGASVLRVHDVRAVRQALAVEQAILRGG